MRFSASRPARMRVGSTAPDLPAAAGSVLQLVDATRSVGLREVVGDLLAGLARQRLQVRRLRAGHRLVAGRPVVRVLLGRGLYVLVHDPGGSRTACGAKTMF